MNTLSIGAQGADVITLQQHLASLGYTVAADGVFGAGTQSIVMQFQTNHNLTADGVVGDATWAELNSLLSASIVGGIDISHNNDTIDWNNLSAQLSFVYCKASQGATFKDPMFQNYMSNLKKAGIIFGAYHFLTFESSAQVQVNNFMNCGIDFSAPGTLPPVLDVEWQVPATLNPYILANQAACIQLISDWLQAVATQTGRTPMIYTATSFWHDYLGNPAGFENYPLWISAYQSAKPPLPPGWNNYAFWQYSGNGTIAGGSGDVDMDRFNGTIDDLKKLAQM